MLSIHSPHGNTTNMSETRKPSNLSVYPQVLSKSGARPRPQPRRSSTHRSLEAYPFHVLLNNKQAQLRRSCHRRPLAVCIAHGQLNSNKTFPSASTNKSKSTHRWGDTSTQLRGLCHNHPLAASLVHGLLNSNKQLSGASTGILESTHRWADASTQLRRSCHHHPLAVCRPHGRLKSNKKFPGASTSKVQSARRRADASTSTRLCRSC